MPFILPEASPGRPLVYQIVVQGPLDDSWANWFSGVSITHTYQRDGTPVTVLTGPIADQAALRGLLTSLWNLNLAVLSVNPIPSDGG
jgi:hypothetical protein